MDGLSETHFSRGVLFPCLLMCPTVFREEHLGYKAKSAGRWFRMEKGCQGGCLYPLCFEFPFCCIGYRKIVFFDA